MLSQRIIDATIAASKTREVAYNQASPYLVKELENEILQKTSQSKCSLWFDVNSARWAYAIDGDSHYPFFVSYSKYAWDEFNRKFSKHFESQGIKYSHNYEQITGTIYLNWCHLLTLPQNELSSASNILYYIHL
jgi:hypothetical protein